MDYCRARAWDKTLKKMCEHGDHGMRVDGFLFHGDGIDVFYDLMGAMESDDVEVMLSIGLLDSKGIEIMEGDILRTPNGDLGAVVWKAPFFEVTVSESDSSLYSREWYADCEVIGDIFRNKDLFDDAN